MVSPGADGLSTEPARFSKRKRSLRAGTFARRPQVCERILWKGVYRLAGGLGLFLPLLVLRLLDRLDGRFGLGLLLGDNLGDR
jgi:hypothetical protein